MAALLKSLRRVANDFRPTAKPRVVPIITLAQRREWMTLGLAVVVAFILSALAGMAFWYFGIGSQHNIEIVTKPAPVAAQTQPQAKPVPQKAVSATAVITNPENVDIALPAETLSPDADLMPAPDADPAVNIVAQKLGDLPALGAEHVKTSDANAALSLPNENDMLTDAHRYLQSGDTAAALAIYDQVLAIHDASHIALMGKAYALQQTGQYDAAIAVLHRLTKRGADDATVRTNLAAALAHSQTDDAYIELVKMVEATPDFAPAQAALAHNLAMQGNMKEALPHLDRAVRLQPSNLLYRLDLAILYDHSGHNGEALALYQQIIHAQMDQDEPQPLPLSLSALRNRADYLAMHIASSASPQLQTPSPSETSGAGAE